MRHRSGYGGPDRRTPAYRFDFFLAPVARPLTALPADFTASPADRTADPAALVAVFALDFAALPLLAAWFFFRVAAPFLGPAQELPLGLMV